MPNLRKTTEIVKEILQSEKQARNSDSYLYLKVISNIAEQIGVNIHGLSVPTFLLSGADMGFVGFETVRRTRQKIQQHHPELAACKAVEDFRAENEKEFYAYAVGDV